MDPPKEQYDHLKATDSTRNAKKKESSFSTARWHEDEFYRHSQTAIRWTEECCQYLKSLMSIDFSRTATGKERLRCEHNLTLGVNGQGPDQ